MYYSDIPSSEPERQFYFMKLLSDYVACREKELNRKLKFHITTFGCQMNARDSEKLSGILKEVGYVEEDDEACADFVLFNTCTVRENANKKLYGRLGTLGVRKKKNRDFMLALCGCMMQEEKVIEKIKSSYRFVDIIFGTHNIYKLAELIYIRSVYNDLARVDELKSLESNELMNVSGSMVIDIWKDTDRIVENIPNDRKYPFKSGINIMFGCNNFCSYCIVPYVRGRERSRNPKDIIAEIEKMAKDGVKEVMLLGQNVNSYGKNLDEPMSFAELLKEVEKIDGIERIRFMTSHPKDLSDELIEVMKSSKKICRHLHLPLQSGSSRILKSMNRHYTKEEYIDLALRIRREIPDIAITTDIIVGYPTETVNDIEDTLDVIKKVQFDNAFTFIYSKRTGTPAATMEGQVSDEFIKEQFDRVLFAVQEASKQRTLMSQGKEVDVLVEEINEHDSDYLTGRMSNNLLVHFKGDKSLIGEIVPVKLIDCKGFYYIGEMICN